MIVMMICHYDDSNPQGGLELQARLLSRTMKAAGEDVVMLASTSNRSRVGWTEDHGVRVRYFWTYASPQISGRYLPAALIWAIQLLMWVMRHQRAIKVIHCHQIRIHAFVAAMATKLFGIPSLLKSATGGGGADIRTIGSRKYFGPAGRRFVTKNVSCFVATTESIKQDLLSYGVDGKKIAVIPNGLQLPSRRDQTRDPIRSRKALFLGRLASDKNPVALASAALMVAPDQGIQVDFWGEGELRGELERVIASGGEQRQVRYLGFSKDPGSVLEEYGFLLLGSEAEGLSNSMLEAMAHGVVPIATKVSGCIDHILPGETGFFFEGTDHQSLVRGLGSISEVDAQSWEKMSHKVQEYAYERFDIRSVVNTYIGLYQSLVGK